MRATTTDDKNLGEDVWPKNLDYAATAACGAVAPDCLKDKNYSVESWQRS